VSDELETAYSMLALPGFDINIHSIKKKCWQIFTCELQNPDVIVVFQLFLGH
jgi:hypothetical protein